MSGRAERTPKVNVLDVRCFGVRFVLFQTAMHYSPYKPRLSWTTIWLISHNDSLFILQGHLKLLQILIHYLPDTPKLSWTTIWPIADTNSLFILRATRGYCELRLPYYTQWLTLHHSLQLFWTTIWPIAHNISLFVWQCKANDNFHLLLTLIFSVHATIQSYFKLRVDLLHTIIHCSPYNCELRFDLLHTPSDTQGLCDLHILLAILCMWLSAP